MRAFGLRLRELRDKAGLSQGQLAERARLNPTSVTKAEAGQTDPRLSLIESLARGLGVPPAALVEDLVHSDELPDDPDTATQPA